MYDAPTIRKEETRPPFLNDSIYLWYYMHCTAIFAINEKQKWMTLYYIETKERFRNRGFASYLLREAKLYAESRGFAFGSTIVLSAPMKHLLRKLQITEYN